MKQTKTIMAFLLSAILILTMLPAAAWAETAAEATAPGGNVTSAAELNKALGGQHALAGNRVTLKEDVVLDRDVIVKASAPLTLDLNGKTITWSKDAQFTLRTSSDELVEQPISGGFYLQSNMVFTGNGRIEIDKPGVSAIMPRGCGLTIQNGTYVAKGDLASAVSVYSQKKDPATLLINGGTFSGGIYSGEGALVNARINGGNISELSLKYPYVMNKAGTNPIISGKNRLRINGGTIGQLYCSYTTVAIKGGSVTEKAQTENSNVYLYGGRIKGAGLDMHSQGRLLMKGGTIRSNDTDALKIFGSTSAKKQNRCNVTLSGGTIAAEKKNAKGIAASGNVIMKLNGTNIKSVKKNGNIGIQLNGKFCALKLTLKSVKNNASYIKGFKTGISQIGKKALVCIGKQTKVYAPKTAKAGYTAGKKLPKRVKGNISIKYAR